MTKSGDLAQPIAEEVYDALKRRLGAFRDFPVLRKRIRDLLSDHGGDSHMVAAVCLAAAELAPFDIFRKIGPVSFIMLRNAMGVPDGAWRYAHLGQVTADAGRAESTEYWLALWRDAEEAGDMDLQLRAQKRLEELWSEGEVGI